MNLLIIASYGKVKINLKTVGYVCPMIQPLENVKII